MNDLSNLVASHVLGLRDAEVVARFVDERL